MAVNRPGNPDIGAAHLRVVAALLALWLAFLGVTILGNVHETGPARELDRVQFDRVASVFAESSRVFDVYIYPFFALDQVRDALSAVAHPARKRSFVLATFVFLLLLCAATFAAPAQSGDAAGGLLAVLLLTTAPFVLATARVYDVHVPRLAAIQLFLAAAWWLARRPSRWSLVALLMAQVLGLVICAHRTDFLFFILAMVGPLAWIVVSGFRRVDGRKWLLGGVGLSAAVAVIGMTVVTGASWYDPVDAVTRFVSFFAEQQAENPLPSIFAAPRALLAYPYVLAKATVGWPLAAALGVGIGAAFWRRVPARGYWLLAALAPLAAMTLVPKRNLYYVANILPPLAVLAGLGWSALPRRWSWRGVVGAVIVVGLFHTALLTGRVTPGQVPRSWAKLFVTGVTRYVPSYADITLESYGSGDPALEDETARDLSNRVFADAPRPLALGFVGAPCRQRRLPVELLWRGIAARDAFCPQPPDSTDQPFDAVVFLPRYRQTPGVYEAADIGAAHAALLEASRQSLPPFHPDEGLSVAGMLKEAQTGIEAFSARYPSRKIVDGYLVFFDPQNPVAARALGRGQ